ncbi:MAG: oligoendopeptidase F, partial [Defluviitaleaceae bacterium]|nr:oligoendopeptidase F [Defluviitaleaceae bacterium]
TGEAFSKLYVYANMKLHEDANNATYQGFTDTADRLHVQLMAAEAFIEPEILTIDENQLLACIDNTPGLELFRHFLENLLRQKAHVLTAEMEELLAKVRELGNAPDNIFSMLDNADIKFGTITDEAGNQVELTHGRYGAMLESPNREVRKTVWHTFYDSYWYLKNTLASTYAASVKKDVFFAKTRKYPSAMDAALFSNNIPTTVYTGLINTVHEFLPLMHRYMNLRKKTMDLPELRVYDLYTPIVKSIDNRVEYNEAVETVLKSLAPLGKEYIDISQKGLKGGGWVDVYENAGKMNGAYSWGAYGGHPYILLNYENKMDDMFTLAHELGHAMHSYYSWENQPYIYGDYTIFLAEVASTVNEALLMDHLLKNNSDPAMKAYLVNTWLEQFRTTVFRQTLFAEFEMITHRMAEEGESLTLEALNGVYRSLNEKYYGDTVVLDDKLDLEWARIPHFYRAFYVYQYATGYSAAMAFANRILGDNGAKASAKYLEFLKGGSSDYSINILKKAGVDMSKPEPVREALEKFGVLLDEMEGLI